MANGGQVTVQVDEASHELHLHGGVLSGKDWSAKLTVPTGSYSYSFQVDLLNIKNNVPVPVLRPCGDAILSDKVFRTISLMGITLTQALLSTELRNLLSQMPEVRLMLDLSADHWDLMLCCGSVQKAMLTQPYSHTRGGLMAAALNTLEHNDLQTPEGRVKVTNQIFEKYLNYLPDYQRVEENRLAFRG